MSSVHKISFRGENTNLLSKASGKSTFATQPAAVTGVQLTSPAAVSDTTEKPVKKKLSGEKIAYVSSAIAIVSLGISTAYGIKSGRLSKKLAAVAKEGQDIAAEITGKIEKGLSESDEIANNLTGKTQKEIDKIKEEVKGLGKWQDGQIDGVRKELSERISQIASSVKSPNAEEILVSPVNVNGMELNLASVMNGYGKYTGELEKSLQSESARRIFGIVDRSKSVIRDDVMIRVPTSEFKTYISTGGMSTVPREVIANLGGIINQKQNARLVVDMPMYLGQVSDDAYFSITKLKNGLFEYRSSKEASPLATLEHINTLQIPIYTDKGKTTELVDMYIARGKTQEVDLELMKPWLEKGLAQELNASIKSGEPFVIDRNLFRIEYNPADNPKPVAKIKYDTVFYKHNKFLMDGPVEEGKAKTIYNNLTHESGETERFMYFDKFFYEGLLHNAETSTENLRADLIIGNDWQTGGISAMMKLLTTAKKYFGLDPKVADKMYNTPVITIMHNAGLMGNVWHSQAKLLNILFGEHSAMITKNAWMPKGSSLNADSLNGLFHGHSFNPQTMAAAYSDTIIPVSKGYGHEMASHSGFGRDNHDIFRMRARYHEYGDMEHLKYIARQNNLDPSQISDVNIAYRPITNGSDRISNKMVPKKLREVEGFLNLEPKSLRMPDECSSIVEWHNHNKQVYLNKVLEDLNKAKTGQGNPMNIELAELTNLDGVTKDTMIVSTAGRIVDQKGLDIFAEAIDEFLSRHKGEDYPVFYAQGVGDKVYINKLLEIKRNAAQKYGQKAADRIVFARLFSEKGRYEGCKMMSDFTVMSSWFEPCGLVHKEIASYSGAIPIVNKVGGLTDGLSDGVNAIFSEMRPKYEKEFDKDALDFNRKAFADALDKAYKIFKDKEKFTQMLENSFNADHSWLKPGGPMEEYARLFADLRVLNQDVLRHN